MLQKSCSWARIALLALLSVPAFASDFFTWGIKGGGVYSANASFGQANATDLKVDTGQTYGWSLGVHGRAADYFATWAISGDVEYLHPLNSSNAQVNVKQSAIRASARLEFAKDSLFNATYYLAGPFVQRMDSRFTPQLGPVVKETRTSLGILGGIGHRWVHEGGKSTFVEFICRDTSAPPKVTLEVYFGLLW